MALGHLTGLIAVLLYLKQWLITQLTHWLSLTFTHSHSTHWCLATLSVYKSERKAGNMCVIEVTLRTPAALWTFKWLRKNKLLDNLIWKNNLIERQFNAFIVINSKFQMTKKKHNSVNQMTFTLIHQILPNGYVSFGANG